MSDEGVRPQPPGSTEAPLQAGRSRRPYIVTINGGSSSLKFAVFTAADPIERVYFGHVERVGLGGSRLIDSEAGGSRSEDRAVEAPNLAAAAGLVIELVGQKLGLASIVAVGHRVVHGGNRFMEPGLVSSEMLEQLRRISPLDPEHLPGEIALIEAVVRTVPGVPQVACFDTAFHRTMPRSAQIVPIPRRYWGLGVRRYGFHGLSYAYLTEELARAGGGVAANRSRSSRLGGEPGRGPRRPMPGDDDGVYTGIRPGHGDPLWRSRSRSHRLPRPCRGDDAGPVPTHGRPGVGPPGSFGDERRFALPPGPTRARSPHGRGRRPVCYRVKTAIGALSAVLGGLDSLVFSGGIGENSPEVRRRVCEGLEFLGIALGNGRNAAGEPLISTDASATRVRVIPTDEELMIARAAIRLVVPPS